MMQGLSLPAYYINAKNQKGDNLCSGHLNLCAGEMEELQDTYFVAVSGCWQWQV